MDKDELKKALYIIGNYIMKLESETFPLSKDHDWIESAISVVARIIQKISNDEEVSGMPDSLFPHNCYDPSIVDQPEIEYRIAKYPFHVRHRYIDAQTGEHRYWDSSHCPVCFWKKEVGLWDSLIGQDDKFCRRCGQKVKWDD